MKNRTGWSLSCAVASIVALGAVPSAAATAAGGGIRAVVEWQYGYLGSGVGGVALLLADLDGDASSELVASASSLGYTAADAWWSLRPGGPGFLQQLSRPLVFPPTDPEITSLCVADVDRDGRLDVVVLSDWKITAYDSRTLEPITSIPTGSWPGDLHVVDIDEDGSLEGVVLERGRSVNIYDLMTGAFESRIAWFGLTGPFEIGDVDGDGTLEIVAGNDYGLVIDSRTHEIEWVNPGGFGSQIRLGDVDGDGGTEIVDTAANELTVWSGALRREKYRVPVPQGLAAVQLGDLEADGTPDIVYSDEGPGRVHVLEGSSGAEKCSVENPGYGSHAIALGDPDWDGTNELIWANSQLFTADCATGEIEWRSEPLPGLFELDAGDIDADGTPEVVYGSPLSTFGAGRWFVRDLTSRRLEFESPPPSNSDWLAPQALVHANVDDDPQAEVFVNSSVLFTGVLDCFDGRTHERQWRSELSDGEAAHALATGDVDGDGSLEVVAGTRGYAFGVEGRLRVFDGATGVEEWHSEGFGRYAAIPVVHIAQLDDDPALEIFAPARGRGIVSVDGLDHSTSVLVEQPGATYFDLVDEDGDGLRDLVVVEDFGTIAVYDTAGQRKRTFGTFWASGLAPRVADLDGDAKPEYVLTVDSELRIYDREDPVAPLWRSGRLGNLGGGGRAPIVGDLDGDGRSEIFTGLGELGVWLFEVARGENAGPVAAAGLDQTLECDGGLSATALLDGTGSSDSDSTPGTRDDIASYAWSEGEQALGTGDVVQFPFPLGDHTVQLTVRDRTGMTDTDSTRILVKDTLPPDGAITSPGEGFCFGPAETPVVVRDDFTDRCGGAVSRVFTPGVGVYSEQGDYAVSLAATDERGNEARSGVRFTIDLVAPSVAITSTLDLLALPVSGGLPFTFTSSDDDGAAGGVVHEWVELRDARLGTACTLYDGLEDGDRDGVLSDEVLLLSVETLCRETAPCGWSEVHAPELRVVAGDCGGNTGAASRGATGTLRLRPGVCERGVR